MSAHSASCRKIIGEAYFQDLPCSCGADPANGPSAQAQSLDEVLAMSSERLAKLVHHLCVALDQVRSRVAQLSAEVAELQDKATEPKAS